MTDEEALRIYDEFFGAATGGQDHSSVVFDDEDRIDLSREVRAMLAAPTLAEAMKVIVWWGCFDRNRACCEAMRAKYDADGKRKVMP